LLLASNGIYCFSNKIEIKFYKRHYSRSLTTVENAPQYDITKLCYQPWDPNYLKPWVNQYSEGECYRNGTFKSENAVGCKLSLKTYPKRDIDYVCSCDSKYSERFSDNIITETGLITLISNTKSNYTFNCDITHKTTNCILTPKFNFIYLIVLLSSLTLCISPKLLEVLFGNSFVYETFSNYPNFIRFLRSKGLVDICTEFCSIPNFKHNIYIFKKSTNFNVYNYSGKDSWKINGFPLKSVVFKNKTYLDYTNSELQKNTVLVNQNVDLGFLEFVLDEMENGSIFCSEDSESHSLSIEEVVEEVGKKSFPIKLGRKILCYGKLKITNYIFNFMKSCYCGPFSFLNGVDENELVRLIIHNALTFSGFNDLALKNAFTGSVFLKKGVECENRVWRRYVSDITHYFHFKKLRLNHNRSLIKKMKPTDFCKKIFYETHEVENLEDHIETMFINEVEYPFIFSSKVEQKDSYSKKVCKDDSEEENIDPIKVFQESEFETEEVRVLMNKTDTKNIKVPPEIFLKKFLVDNDRKVFKKDLDLDCTKRFKPQFKMDPSIEVNVNPYSIFPVFKVKDNKTNQNEVCTNRNFLNEVKERYNKSYQILKEIDKLRDEWIEVKKGDKHMTKNRFIYERRKNDPIAQENFYSLLDRSYLYSSDLKYRFDAETPKEKEAFSEEIENVPVKIGPLSKRAKSECIETIECFEKTFEIINKENKNKKFSKNKARNKKEGEKEKRGKTKVKEKIDTLQKNYSNLCETPIKTIQAIKVLSLNKRERDQFSIWKPVEFEGLKFNLASFIKKKNRNLLLKIMRKSSGVVKRNLKKQDKNSLKNTIGVKIKRKERDYKKDFFSPLAFYLTLRSSVVGFLDENLANYGKILDNIYNLESLLENQLEEED